MFVHLRYVALACLFIILGGAGAIFYYYYQYKIADMEQAGISSLKAAVGSYNAVIWDRYAPEIAGNTNSPYMAMYTGETQRFFHAQPVVKATLFSADLSKLYYSSTSDYVTSNGATRIPLFSLDKAGGGAAVSRILTEAHLNGATDAKDKRIMLQAIIPLTRAGSSRPEALAELYVDLTEQWSDLEYNMSLFVGGTLALFVLLTCLVIYTATHAENIISKQHEVNLELIAAAAQAEAQSRDKSQFLASVSHELRTPLNAIIGFSEIIRNEAREVMQKVHQDYLDDINASGKHLLSLINDILDFSKAEAGKLQIEWAETDATKIIRNSLRMVLPRAEAAQVTLVEEVPNHHLVIVTDAKKLKQVLLNLLSNAVKFTPAGGEVRCHAWNNIITGELTIQVKDTGIGIAPKDISRVMTPFGQVDSALSRKYEGTGLGLPLSKKFVESMGGTFTIESQLKVGTTVTVTVPKAPPGWGTAPPEPQAGEQESLKEPPHVA